MTKYRRSLCFALAFIAFSNPSVGQAQQQPNLEDGKGDRPRSDSLTLEGLKAELDNLRRATGQSIKVLQQQNDRLRQRVTALEAR